jgi:hypothetical protein
MSTNSGIVLSFCLRSRQKRTRLKCDGIRRMTFQAIASHAVQAATVLQQARLLGGIIWKQAGGILRSERRNVDMKSKLGAAVLLSLLYAQGLLGVAAVAAVIMKDPPKQHMVTRWASVESLVSVR